jgi:hypothetical protein
MSMVRSGAALAMAALLGACSTFPTLDAQISPEAQSADFPALLPAEELRAQVATGPIEPREQPIVAQAEQIDNRANALRARAASLRGDVIDEEDRDRLDTKIEIEDEEA